MTDQELKDLVASLAVESKKTERQIRQVGRQLDELGNKWGSFTEGMAAGKGRKRRAQKPAARAESSTYPPTVGNHIAPASLIVQRKASCKTSVLRMAQWPALQTPTPSGMHLKLAGFIASNITQKTQDQARFAKPSTGKDRACVRIAAVHAQPESTQGGGL